MWIKGKSGNPNGRPKLGETFTDLVRLEAEVTSDVDDGTGGKLSKKLAVVKKMYELAIGGDVPMIKYLIDRTDGRPVETSKHSIEFKPDQYRTELAKLTTEEVMDEIRRLQSENKSGD